MATLEIQPEAGAFRSAASAAGAAVLPTFWKEVKLDEIIQVEAAERLLGRDSFEALALALIRLDLSRYEVADWLADTIFRWLEEGGKIVDEHGDVIQFTDETIDNVHGKDGSLRVISSIILHGRGKQRQRAGRKSMAALMRVYDAAFKIAGRPLFIEARRKELGRMREIVRAFTPAQRHRYLIIVRKLRREHKGDRRAYYSAALRRVRLQLAAEISN